MQCYFKSGFKTNEKRIVWSCFNGIRNRDTERTILQCVFSKKKTSNIRHCFSFWNNYFEFFGNANSATNMVIIAYRKLSKCKAAVQGEVVWNAWENEKNVVCTHQYAWGDDLQKARYGVEKIRCNECGNFFEIKIRQEKIVCHGYND